MAQSSLQSYSDGWIRVYSINNGQLLGVLDGIASSLAFSWDGSLLAAGLSNGTIRIFSLDDGSHTDLTPPHKAAVHRAGLLTGWQAVGRGQR